MSWNSDRVYPKADACRISRVTGCSRSPAEGLDHAAGEKRNGMGDGNQQSHASGGQTSKTYPPLFLGVFLYAVKYKCKLGREEMTEGVSGVVLCVGDGSVFGMGRASFGGDGGPGRTRRVFIL